MTTLDSLKQALRQKATETTSSPTRPLSPTQYCDGFSRLVQGPGWTNYRTFIIPRLSELLDSIFDPHSRISVLEIGPGPKSILSHLPERQRQKVERYTAFEPNEMFALALPDTFRVRHHSLRCHEPVIHQLPFNLETDIGEQKHDLILFCHSMYGMPHKRKILERALDMLSPNGMVVVFHRDRLLDHHLTGLVCHRTISFPTGVVPVADDDHTLDHVASFVAGFVMQDVDADQAVREEWRKVCHALGRKEEAYPDHLLFSAPESMMVFTKHATALPELIGEVPLAEGVTLVKSWEARGHRPAAIFRPREIEQVQRCVKWALEHRVGLTVVGGGHSGHCLQSNVVAVDMSAFNQVHVLTAEEDGVENGRPSGPLVVAQAGCKTWDIICKTKMEDLTVPMGARPSVGAGLWLQGGIGHQSRLHGLTCDSIVGATVVSVNSGQVFCVGYVPSQHQPKGAVRPENEAELLWAIKGAGTNFGIVISVTFKAYTAPRYLVRNWIIPLKDKDEAQSRLSFFDKIIVKKLELPRHCSADAYLYWEAGQLHLGVTVLELRNATPTPKAILAIREIWGEGSEKRSVDGIGLFDTEMYVSGMHGGHSGGKTNSFKRCVFMRDIGDPHVANSLIAAIETRPSSFCYLHLLHGGGAIGDVAADATAFGCRDWDFACVITGVWPRDQHGTETGLAEIQWVYNVSRDLLSPSICSGVYGADLGPDPRDAQLAARAFGTNRSRLHRLKHHLDPHNVLASACPLPRLPRLIFLVTGESCAGKDHIAEAWVHEFTNRNIKASAVSISDVTKREYASATGADLNRLLQDRVYKEQHRPALTKFWKEQARQRPRLPEEHFLSVAHNAIDIDVLFITGMRDESPVAAFSHLVPDSRVLEVHVQASERVRQSRRGQHGDVADEDNKDNIASSSLTHCPSLIFNNDMTGDQAAKDFAEKHLLPFLHEDLERLASMVRSIPDFPRPGIEFRDVLGIAQQPGGLTLSTSLLKTHFGGNWGKIDVVASCEAGGFVFASALASQVDVPLVSIREAGKLPPPTVSVVKPRSYISSLEFSDALEKRFEMGQEVIPKGASVVVVDDVLSTGETLCAVLELLREAGVDIERVSVMIVAEFPLHRGRELLRQRGFGKVGVQSLLVFGGA